MAETFKDPFAELAGPPAIGPPRDALKELQSNATLRRITGQEQRSNTSLAGDIAALAAKRKGFTDLSINPDDINAEVQRKTRRVSDITGKEAESALNMAKFGAFPGGMGKLSTAPATGAELVSPSRPKEQGVPLDTAAAKATVASIGDVDTLKREYITLGPKGFPMTTTRTSKHSVQLKGSDPTVMKYVREQILNDPSLKGRVDASTIKVADDGTVTATVDRVPNSVLKGVFDIQ